MKKKFFSSILIIILLSSCLGFRPVDAHGVNQYCIWDCCNNTGKEISLYETGSESKVEPQYVINHHPTNTPTPTPTPTPTNTPKPTPTPTPTKKLAVDLNDKQYTVAEMYADAYELVDVYSGVELEVFGTSYDNRDLISLSAGNKNSKNLLYIVSATHAREYQNMLLNMYMFNHLLEYNQDLLKNCYVVFVPCLNPDGVQISMFGVDGINDAELKKGLNDIRNSDIKNGYVSKYDTTYWKRWKANAVGLDLNQQYDAFWQDVTKKLKKSASSENYGGTAPEQAKEVVAQLEQFNLLRTQYSNIAVLSYHSMGRVLYWGEPKKYSPNYEADKSFMNTVKKATGYMDIYSWEISRAGFTDWTCIEGIPGVTVETFRGNAGVDYFDVPSEYQLNKTVFTDSIKWLLKR